MDLVPELDSEILECLRGVIDPELGIDVVDLGLVYEARRQPDAIRVDITLTTRACPLGPMMLDNVRTALGAHYPGAEFDIRLVWTPAWNPDRITERGRVMLGRPPAGAE